MAKKLLVLILTSTFFLNCARQRQRRFDRLIEQKQCDKALEKIPYKNKQTVPGGQALSLGATAVAYTADILIVVAGGTLIFAFLCGPTLAANAASRSGVQHIQCLPADLDGIELPKLGKTTYEATQKWRCPELTQFSISLRQVMGCYEGTGAREDLVKATKQLNEFTNHSSYKYCVDPDEKLRIEKLKESLSEKLSGHEKEKGKI